MAKTTKPKSRINRKTQKGFQFKPWMAVLMVLLIIIAGVIIVRFSQASSPGWGIMYPNGEYTRHDGGSLVNNGDYLVWRTSVNEIASTTWQYYGPYEKLTVWPDGTTKKINSCLTVRDNIPFGIRAKFRYDIVAAGSSGQNAGKVLARKDIEMGKNRPAKGTSNGYELFCLDANLDQANGFPYELKQVEYRVQMQQGSIDIVQLSRFLDGTITTDKVLPLQKTNRCPDGSADVGEVQTYGQGKVPAQKVYLCEYRGKKVSLNIITDLKNMTEAAAAAGIDLGITSAFRSYDEQVALRSINGCPNVFSSPPSSCRIPTAIPGTSNHERGDAIDFSNTSSQGTANFRWLSANASRYGFNNYAPEPWHWSRTGR